MRPQSCPLGELVEINPSLPSDISPLETAAFVPMAALNAENASISIEESRPIGEMANGFSYFQSGDILVAKITPCFQNGKIAEATVPTQHAFGSTEFHVLRPKRDRLVGRYLLHFLRQNWVLQEGERKMTGSAGQRRVPKYFLESLTVPTPPVPEQRRIAAILDQAEALRAKRRFALAKLDPLAQSIFMEMFGDPVSNPNGWDRASLGSIGSCVTGNTPPRAVPEYFGDAIEWIKSDNLNTPSCLVTKAEEGLSEAGKRIARVAPAGSILVTCIAGSPACIGNAAITDREVAFNQQINAVIPILADTRFLYCQFLVGKRLVQEASTASMKGMVNKSRFEEIKFIVPPRRLQESFGRIFGQIQGLNRPQEKQITHLDALFASLQHRAFQGEL